MPFTVVLDTCVIYPAHLRDTLLRQAERGLSAGLAEEFDDYVAALREHHRRRPTLIAMLDTAGLR